MEQELDALSHHMLMAAINSQLPGVLEYLDKRRCALQLARAAFMHFHKLDSVLPRWLSMHVSLRVQLSTIVREVESRAVVVGGGGLEGNNNMYITCVPVNQ